MCSSLGYTAILFGGRVLRVFYNTSDEHHATGGHLAYYSSDTDIVPTDWFHIATPLVTDS